MRILLDTHTFLWWISSPEQLPQNLIERFENPKNELLLSVVSSWEVQIKIGLGKLKLRENWKILLQREIETNAFRILPIHLKHTFVLEKIRPLHRDPFDRMLIAQALSEDLILATRDELITQYPEVSTIWK